MAIKWYDFKERRPDLHINEQTDEGKSERLLLMINNEIYVGYFNLTMVENPDTREYNVPVYSFELGSFSLTELNRYHCKAPINDDGQLTEDNFDECSIYWAYTSSIQGGIP